MTGSVTLGFPSPNLGFPGACGDFSAIEATVMLPVAVTVTVASGVIPTLKSE